MHIWEHIIDDSEIIGIGPLLTKQSPVDIDRSLFNSRNLKFLVHCKNQSISIESDFFNIGFAGDTTEAVKKGRKLFNEYTEAYNDVKQKIFNLIQSRQTL